MGEQCSAEISNLKEKLKNAEGITNNVPSNTELQSKEDAYRKTIAEADSLLSKMETEYQTKIKCLQCEKSSLEEQVRLLEQSQGYLKNQLAKVIDDTERKEEIANLAERLLAADRRELDLKEKLHNLQKAEKEMELALQEQKRANEDLKQELKDQDDLIESSNKFQQENQRLSADVSRSRESESFLG